MEDFSLVKKEILLVFVQSVLRINFKLNGYGYLPFILLRPFMVKKQLPKQLFSLITYDLVLFAKMYSSINKTANKEIMTE